MNGILEAVEQEETLCDVVETVKVHIYIGDRVCAGGGCEAAVTTRRRCWCAKLRECGELLYGRKIPLKRKEAIYLLLCRVSNSVWK